MHKAPSSPSHTANLSGLIETAIYRYKRLLKKFWWILFLTSSLGVFAMAWFTLSRPVSYISTARMFVSGQVALPESSTYREELANFYGTQVELMMSREVRRRAEARVQALRPELSPVPVSITAGVSKGTSIFNLSAVGAAPDYTQALLNAVMEEFLNYKREVRSNVTETTVTSIGEEIVKLEKELRDGEDALIEFQRKNNLPALEEAGNDAARFLAELKRRLAYQEQELNLLNMLDLDQAIERSGSRAPGVEGGPDAKTAVEAMALAGPQQAYMQARQQLQMLQAELAEMSRVLRPKHPKIARLNEDIRRQQNLIEIHRKQAIEQIASRKQAIELEIRNLNAQIKEWEGKALEASRGKAEFERLRANVERARAQLDRYSQTYRSVTATKNVDAELVSIMERASVPVETRPDFMKSLLMGLVVGFAFGAGILFLIDRLDDRINSQSEFESHFQEYVVGHIPLEGRKGGRVRLLTAKDERHSFAEAFRNVRSSIYYMPLDGPRPRLFMITSATPSEGKSTISSNLAITMAVAGSRVLLVDGDMRRGALHELFACEHSPGFSEAIQGQMGWQEATLATSIANLHFIPRGSAITNASEIFLRPEMDAILQGFLDVYEYIIFDSPPVLAADDATSLGPKLDAVLFVLRLGQTTSRQAKKSLDLLYGRQANVLGVILNCTDPAMPEYKYYYQYAGYYSASEPSKDKERSGRSRKENAAPAA